MNELQRELLRACFGGGVAAWHAWRDAVEVDTLDRHSQWLLPLLYRRLHALRVENSLLQRYKNVYLHNWYKNRLLLTTVAEVVAVLPDVPCVATTGLGLVMHAYEDVGVRPLHEATLCVPRAQWEHVVQRLTDAKLSFQEGETLIFPTKAHIPLTLTTDDATLPANWWQRVEMTSFQTLPCTRLSDTDQVAYLLNNRARWDKQSDLLWWADAMTLAQRQASPAPELAAQVAWLPRVA